MTEYQNLSVTILLPLILFGFLLLEDSGDDDDQGGGLMQPVYQGNRAS